ncbi:hypothetical protein T01_10225 [Trichinella spiralis]|uniref:Uncharacterized protein n=1 Tax=Trichinella spiralis TaxID=6334 RepID=A0A0V0Z246_TRISP|nr:hypothetical protein T01_10225 [Trichinella spiralis]
MLFMILIIHGASARYQDCSCLNQFSLRYMHITSVEQKAYP